MLRRCIWKSTWYPLVTKGTNVQNPSFFHNHEVQVGSSSCRILNTRVVDTPTADAAFLINKLGNSSIILFSWFWATIRLSLNFFQFIVTNHKCYRTCFFFKSIDKVDDSILVWSSATLIFCPKCTLNLGKMFEFIILLYQKYAFLNII